MAFAAAFTIIALPAIWLFTRGEANSGAGAPTIAAAGVEAEAGGGVGEPTTDAESAMGTNAPIFIDGPTTPPKPAVINIAIPSTDNSVAVDGEASYKSVVGAEVDTCSAPGAPFGALLTVTNRDNGRVVTCVNRAPIGLPDGLSLQLNTVQFSEIGELVDAPIPVRISWSATG